jgi:hypothetical protein
MKFNVVASNKIKVHEIGLHGSKLFELPQGLSLNWYKYNSYDLEGFGYHNIIINTVAAMH